MHTVDCFSEVWSSLLDSSEDVLSPGYIFFAYPNWLCVTCWDIWIDNLCPPDNPLPCSLDLNSSLRYGYSWSRAKQAVLKPKNTGVHGYRGALQTHANLARARSKLSERLNELGGARCPEGTKGVKMLEQGGMVDDHDGCCWWWWLILMMMTMMIVYDDGLWWWWWWR